MNCVICKRTMHIGYSMTYCDQQYNNTNPHRYVVDKDLGKANQYELTKFIGSMAYSCYVYDNLTKVDSWPLKSSGHSTLFSDANRTPNDEAETLLNRIIKLQAFT